MWTKIWILLAVIQYVYSSATLKVKFKRFNNYDGKDSDGVCCDGVAFFCEPYGGCDPYFKICIGSASNTNPNSCPHGTITTGAYNNMQQSIAFTSKVVDKTNPIQFTFAKWPTTVAIVVDVTDDDDGVPGHHDHIVKFSQDYSQTPHTYSASPVISSISISSGSKRKLDLDVSVQCDQHYYGPTCEVECRPSDRYRCHQNTGAKICNTGWGGPDCLPINECESNPCLNGGLCDDREGHYTCGCVPGYIGLHCETDKNECLSNPCQNGGTCNDELNKYRCECVTGWTGDSCEENVDDCSSNPCGHHGQCTDGFNNFTCSCSPGVTGPLCQTVIDVCESQPCLNNASCSHSEGVYYCRCADGWEGVTCENKIQPCDAEPCKNGGSCSEKDGAFVCKCPSGYSGPICEKKQELSRTEWAKSFIYLDGIVTIYQKVMITDAIKEVVTRRILISKKDIDVAMEVDVCDGGTGKKITQIAFTVENTLKQGQITKETVDGAFMNTDRSDLNALMPYKVLTESEGCANGNIGASTDDDNQVGTAGQRSNWINSNWWVILVALVGVAFLVLIVFAAMKIRRRQVLKKEAADPYATIGNRWQSGDSPDCSQAYQNKLYDELNRKNTNTETSNGVAFQNNAFEHELQPAQAQADPTNTAAPEYATPIKIIEKTNMAVPNGYATPTNGYATPKNVNSFDNPNYSTKEDTAKSELDDAEQEHVEYEPETKPDQVDIDFPDNANFSV